MARTSIAFSSLIFSFFHIATTLKTSAPASAIINQACKSTLYPDVCVPTLTDHVKSSNPTPHELAQIMLSESVAKTQAAKSFMSQLSNDKKLNANEHAALKDCLDGANDGVDQLRQSVRELKEMSGAKGEDFLWHKSNVQTWVSSALTYQHDCNDNFGKAGLNGEIKNAMEEKVGGALQVTSNALALVNRLN